MMDSARTQPITTRWIERLAHGVSVAAVTIFIFAMLVVRAGAAPVAAESVSAGSDFTCAVISGAAECWGRNDNGENGNGTFATSTTEGHALIPAQVSGLTSGVTAISAGDGFACAIVSGAAKCWGKNNSGQLGNGSNTVSATPVQVTGLTSGVTAISAGYGHACAAVSGAAKCWGSQASFFGALGNGVDGNGDDNFDDSSVPVQVSGLTSGVTAISANLTNSCAVVSGAVKCWGSQFYGQLGNGVDSSGGGILSSPTPVSVTGLTTGATQLSAGYEYTCAVVSSAADCWGHNDVGQLGDGTFTTATTAMHPTGLTSGVEDIDASTLDTCAIISGAAKCWGRNYRGQLGDGTQDNHYTPTDVLGLGSGVTDISTGWNHTCAIVSGFVWCWGSDWYGEAGDGRGEYERDVTSPVQVVDTIPPPPEGPVITVQSPLEGQTIQSPSLSVAFTATADTTVTTQCQLDDADLVPCTSPWNLTGLSNGTHIVRIYASDALDVESMLEVNFTVNVTTPPFTVNVTTPPQGGNGQSTLPSKPVLEKLPKSIRFPKGITLHVTCVAACTLKLTLKIGTKKVKLPPVSVAAGITSVTPIKVKLSARIKRQIEAALNKKRKVLLSITPESAAIRGDAVTVRLR